MTMPSLHSDDHDTILYDVQHGDSLSRIIRRYHGPLAPGKQQAIIKRILLENPEIRDPNRIYPGQILVLDIPRQYCPIPKIMVPPVVTIDERAIGTLKQGLENTGKEQKTIISTLAPLTLAAASTGLGTLDYTFKSNAPLVAELAENYQDLMEKKITRGQYDYRRVKILKKLETKLGPLMRIGMGSKRPVNEVLRITRKKDAIPTKIIERKAERLLNLSRNLSRGGSVVLAGASLGVACHDIAHTDSRQEKNEILVEALGGIMGGVLYGTAVTLAIAMMATPVGWVAALVIAGVGAGVSYGFGVGARDLYTNMYSLDGNTIDIVHRLSIDAVCR